MGGTPGVVNLIYIVYFFISKKIKWIHNPFRFENTCLKHSNSESRTNEWWHEGKVEDQKGYKLMKKPQYLKGKNMNLDKVFRQQVWGKKEIMKEMIQLDKSASKNNISKTQINQLSKLKNKLKAMLLKEEQSWR